MNRYVTIPRRMIGPAKRVVLLCPALASLLLASLAAMHATDMTQPPKKPNIILIMADDLGHAGLGCYGQKLIPGKKRFLYEGGIRVPMIVRWPG